MSFIESQGIRLGDESIGSEDRRDRVKTESVGVEDKTFGMEDVRVSASKEKSLGTR